MPAARRSAAPDPHALLAWYDRHARTLPWRVGPAERAAGARPDPYRVWLSEVMLQQTTTAHAAPYFRAFTERWPTVRHLADAADADLMAAWAGLGYYARARNLLACARAVARDHDGRFPGTEAGLRALPGIGPYTAAAIAAIAFDRPAVVVDGNVERVVARLEAIATPLPAAKPALREAAARLSPERRPGDFWQAMMDLGATICTPRRPACALCPWSESCAARAAGIADRLPAKTRKAAKPLRRGVAFVALDASDRPLVETRPPSGLLGGMAGLPGGAWAEGAAPEPTPPLDLDWRPAGEARHVFTHFALRLEVRAARAPADAPGPFLDDAARALPSVFRKALALGRAALDPASGA